MSSPPKAAAPPAADSSASPAGTAPPAGAAPPSKPNRRPRRGPIARVYRVVYWTFVVGVLGSISGSVTWHVLFRSPSASAASEPLDSAGCSQSLSDLYRDLRGGARTVLFSRPVPSSDLESEWRAFSAGWRTNFERVRARCPTGTDAEARRMVADVERMHVAWSTAMGALADVGRRPLTRLPDQLVPEAPETLSP